MQYIPPSGCTYTEWVNVGMALKLEGYPLSTWEAWSAEDSNRFHPGECAAKWETFRGSASPVTAGTIVQMAKDRGWQPQSTGNALIDWDDIIQADKQDDAVVIDSTWVESKEIEIPDHWQPQQQLITYLETLFSSDENVGYVTKSYESKTSGGKYVPTKGVWDRTAGQLIDELSRCGGDVGKVLGDYNPDVGAWIRFNPLDGGGVKNDNVTDFRYALVESDSLELSRQNALIRELELPVAALVYSGGKSLHAIVKIEAHDYREYQKRVDYLYAVCTKNGLAVDTQNKNPSRLSRMPGVMRGGEKQYLLDVNIGKSSWDAWQEWIAALNDDLPDFENLAVYEESLPALSPPLIDGVLRQGHKMLMAGPSKAGKSFALIELCICIAEGVRWLGRQCARGKVLYVNLELDKASCLHRFFDVYKAMHLPRNHIQNIEIWNLRGQSVPMDKLAPKLIRRAEKQHFIAVIIDPIYKVITGDENSADQMANFCNQFDKICTALGCSVIYCHHHSKGAQGDKRSMDRASGSGVFARDPDALLDLIELEITDSLRAQEENKAVCTAMLQAINELEPAVLDDIPQDDQCSSTALQKRAQQLLSKVQYDLLCDRVEDAKKTVAGYTAWRMEGTLREFPKFSPVNCWFRYPIHEVDSIGSLADLQADSHWQANLKKSGKRRGTPEQRKADQKQALDTAFDCCCNDGVTSIKELSNYMGVTEKTVRNYIENHGNYWIDNGEVGRKKG